MTETKPTIKIETAGDMLAHGYGLRAYCRPCEKTTDVDLAALPSTKIIKAGVLKCARCGTAGHITIYPLNTGPSA